MSALDAGPAAPRFVVRACCARSAEAGGGFLEPVDLPECQSACARDRGGGKVIEERTGHTRKWSVAVHEASHSFAMLRCGFGASAVRLDPPAHAEWGGSNVWDPLARAAIYIAGPVGERWSENRIVRAFDDQLAPAFAAVKVGAAGNCDECRSMYWACVAVMAKGGNEDDPEQVFAAWRDAELMAIELVTKRPNFFPITRLAKILMMNGIATEDEVWSCLSEDMLSSPWPHEPEPEEKTIWLTF